MRQYLAILWFTLTGKYPARHFQKCFSQSRKSGILFSKKQNTGPDIRPDISRLELNKFGIDMPSVSSHPSIDERELHPHVFEQPPRSQKASFSDDSQDSDRAADDHVSAFNDNPENASPIPDITVGSIMTWGLLKTAALIVLIWFVIERFHLHNYWFVSLGVFWLAVMYPAFLQYQRFKEQTQHLKQNSLCATCCHFDETGHFCQLMDEHVSENYIPCEGLRWEAKKS